ncbi:RmlC-like cupin domain-containing protein [Cyathus striatus]|nr:RmlC-like cupin domain-containing protein [Cyathus striatus]
MSALKFVPRRSEERGHASHGWLKTFHTFSFAGYFDNNHESFGPLRVLNEDRVDAYTGFDTHSHREFEIFSYVVEGALEHKDSLGNIEQLPRGTLQLTSAGTGISHSEKAYGSSPVHFLQIWAKPWKAGLQPKYYTRRFTNEEKMDKWAKVVAPYGSEGVNDEREGEGPAPVQSALTMYASIVSPGTQLDRALKGSKAYVHVVQTSGYKTGPGAGASVKIGDGDGDGEVELREGDGVYVFVGAGGGIVKVENVGESTAEVLVFDLE